MQITLTLFSRQLNQPEKKGLKILRFDFGPNNEVIWTMFDEYHPAEGRQNKREHPREFTEH
jgi:hypothetical protein